MRQKDNKGRMYFRFLVFAFGLGFVLLGCDPNKEYELRFVRRSPQRAAVVALKSDNPDERYRALKEIAKSKSFKDDWAVTTLEVIARTDPSSSVRALAVRTLGRVGDSRVLKSLADALNDPSARVRSEAAWAIGHIDFSKIKADMEIMSKLKENLKLTLTSDESVDVRLNSAEALGQFKYEDVLYSLISALKDKEFSVRFQAERSLVKLTGMTFYGDPDKWLDWLKRVKDPFKYAGRVPPELVKPKLSPWERMRERMYRFYLDWQGPAKQ